MTKILSLEHTNVLERKTAKRHFCPLRHLIRYRTGTSLQLRLMRGIFSDANHIHLFIRWPNTVFVRSLADAIQRARARAANNKHAIDTAITLVAQCSHYLYFFSS